MSAVVQFATVPEQALEDAERLAELADHLIELGQRLDVLEAMAAENGANPLTEILTRLDAFETWLTRLERHLRRPPPFPITVIENLDDQAQQRLKNEMNELSRSIATERHEQSRKNVEHDKALDAFNVRLNQAAAQFSRMRERLAAVEQQGANDGKQGATP